MIVTVTPNAALDRTATVPNFQVGTRSRSSHSLRQPGGKGVNVARALRLLGQPVIATGLAGGSTGNDIIQDLTAEGILNDFVRIHDDSRASLAVVDPTNSQQTEVNEVGPMVEAAELDVLVDKLRYLARGADVFALAGSLPPNVPTELYATLVRELRQHGAVVAVDAHGRALEQAIAAEPDIVSPNEREAEEILGYEFRDEDDRLAAVERLVDMGARSAVMHGPHGCVASVAVGERSDESRVLLRGSLEVREVLSTVGSGDAFLAGFLTGRKRRSSPEDTVALAVACGAANTQRLGAGNFDPADVEVYMRQVEVAEAAS